MRAGLVLAAALSLILAGCSAGAGDPTAGLSRGVPGSSLPSVGASPPPAGVASPAAAKVELAAFSSVIRQTVQREVHPGGRAFIDALVAAGFQKEFLQVTEDRTTIGLAAPSVQFSVLWKGVCLIGQYGSGVGYHAVSALPVAGKCLIGKTRRIDW